MTTMPKIALVHDWLIAFGGAEQALTTFTQIWPQAPIYTLLYDQKGPCGKEFAGKKIVTSSLQKFPGALKNHRNLLLFMPYAIEQLNLSDYDIIISGSHCVAKGVITKSSQLHISYVYTPMRYAWDFYHEYMKNGGYDHGIKSSLVRMVLHYIRLWDYRTSNQVNEFLAISNYVANRIWKVYRRNAKVIYPPVNVEKFSIKHNKDNFYLVVSRLVQYKRVDLIIEAFTKLPQKKLIIIGDGPMLKNYSAMASPNILFLGYQERNKVIEYMQNARALIFATEEDFGIVPVEAQACGTPVIAYGKGGALETILSLENDPSPTGLFFYSQSVPAIIDAVNQFENSQSSFIPENCRKNSLRFSTERFKAEINEFVNQKFEVFKNGNLRTE